MGPKVSAWLAANRTEALGLGAAAVAGLALYSRKRKGAAAPGVSPGASIPGTIPAAAVVSAGGSVPTYDSSSFDAYNALQDEIGTLARNSEAARNTGATGSGVSAAVSVPIASTLLAPVGSGRYVQNANGTIAEVESDGSLYGMQAGEFLSAYNAGARPQAYVGNDLQMYSIAQNLAARQKAAVSPVAAASATSGA